MRARLAWRGIAAFVVAGVFGLTTEALGQSPPGVSGVGDTSIQGEIRGRLRGTVTPLPHAMIEVLARRTRRSVLADAAGRYTISGLAPGEVTLRVSHVGYEPLSLTVAVPEGAPMELALELTAVPLRLPAVDVLGDPLDRRGVAAERDEAGYALPGLDLEALEVGPGVGQGGLADVVGALPGNDPDEATDVLFMRGSTADLKLVLLDGVPVYTPFHVAGLMKSFEQSVLGAAELHVGGAPARYDGGLTNILDLRTRAARRDRLRVSGAVDVLTASAALESPLGPGVGVIASGRALHALGERPMGGAAPYGYRDALVSASVEPSEEHALRATGFWNEESVRLDPDRAPTSARWANRAGALAYRGTIAGTRVDVTAGSSTYRATLPLQPSLPPGAPPGQPLPAPVLATAATDRMRVVGEVTWGSPGALVRTGLSAETIDERFSARPASGNATSALRGSGGVLGAFLDVTRPVGPGLSLRAGARADHFGHGRLLWAPRAAISWEVGPEALVTIAAGRYHQPTRTTDAQVERTLETIATGGSNFSERLGVASADHVVLGLDQRLGTAVRMGLEGFWKSYRNLPSSGPEAVRSSGVDVRIVTAGERRAAWLGYGLSWFWSNVDLSGRTSEFVGRQLLTAGVSGPLAGRLEAEARVAYGAGLPYTSIPFRAESTALPIASPSRTVNTMAQAALPDDQPRVDGGLDETFLRVDVEVHALFEPTWGGRPWRVRPYVRVLNALDRRDALFYTYQPWRSEEATPLGERRMLPLLGVAFSF